jgi:hypothetical protein
MLDAEPIFTVHADVAAMMDFGTTPSGGRRFVAITGGRVSGRKLSGRILPGGADWQVIRSDGAADISARYVIEADSGAHVLVASDGVRHGPPDVLARLQRGDGVDPSLYYFRTAMRFETAEPSLGWLNRIIAVARGAREARRVKLDVFEVK